MMSESNNVENQRIPILIAGATGDLGRLITQECIKNPNLLVNILVRDPQKNQELTNQVKKFSGQVLQADLSKPESLDGVSQGMHTVISVIHGDDAFVKVEGQKALFQECAKSGVKRIVPADYGLNYTKFDREDLLAASRAADKVKLEDYLKESKVPLLRFFVGIFAEWFVDAFKKEKTFYGDPNLKHNVTTEENVARLVAAGIATKELTGQMYYAGGNYTVKEFQDIYNRVRGTNVQIKHAGSLDDLRRKYEEKKAKEGDTEDVRVMKQMLLFFDERSKFPQLDNESFPDVKPTFMEEFLTQNQAISL